MIITVAPYPAVEYVYEVNSLVENQTMHATATKINILSKGIHSAEVIKILQDEAMVIGLLGGFSGKYIKHCMDKAKIKSDMVWTDGETLHQMNIVVPSSKDYYSVEREKDTLTERELIKLTQKTKNYFPNVSTMILAGYVPEPLETSFYSELIKEGKGYNIKAIVSTGQKTVLEQVLEESPYALMFTKHQLKTLGIDFSSIEGWSTFVTDCLEKGVHYVGLYLKEEGTFFISKNKTCVIEQVSNSPLEWAKSSSGAYLGAFAIGISRKYEQEKIAKLTAAAARAATDTEEMPICCKKEVDILLKKVKIREL